MPDSLFFYLESLFCNVLLMRALCFIAFFKKCKNDNRWCENDNRRCKNDNKWIKKLHLRQLQITLLLIICYSAAVILYLKVKSYLKYQSLNHLGNH